jgi:hypothetical protein
MPRATADQAVSPAVGRAAALLLCWARPRDVEAVTFILADITTVSEAKDTLLAVLMLGTDTSHLSASLPRLRAIACRAREAA